ncbi:MAG: aldo/keto reductase [Ilumatobacteraceae bacterium]
MRDSGDTHRQGLGCMRMREGTASDPDRDSVAVVRAALDAGVTVLDTADMYGNEVLVGRTFRGRRDEVLLCSKFGVVWGHDGDWSVRADATYVSDACEASLRRLDVDTIDLYYLHHRSDSTPIEETVTAMAALVDQGKVRALGLSNVTEEDLRRADAVHPITAVQEEWSLAERGIERMVPALAELRVTMVAHSPTGHGALHVTQAGDGEVDAMEPVRTALAEIAISHNVRPGQIALAWVHHRSLRWAIPVVPLPGTTRVSHLHHNVAAAGITLTDAELERLDAASDAPGLTRPNASTG